MNRLHRTLQQITAILDRLGLKYALVGGIAVSTRSEERLTRDIDLAVVVTSDALAEQVVYALGQEGYAVVATVEQDAADRLATVRMQRTRRANEPMVDLLFASSGIEPEVVAGAEPLRLAPRVVVPVARLEHLIALKVLAQCDERPQDVADLKTLLKTATPAQLQQVPPLLDLIVKRGFHRQKDLAAAFRQFMNRFRSDLDRST